MRRTTATPVRDNPDRASFTACVQVGPLHPRSRTRKDPGDRAVLNRPKGVNGIFGRDGAISGSSYGVWVWLVGISLTWAVLGGDGGPGFDAWFGVSGKGAGVVVSEFGLEKDY